MSVRFARAACAAAFVAASASCANPFAPQYEYEEQVYLSVDGRATVVIDTSLPALLVLRGIAIDPAAARSAIRRQFVETGCQVDDVSRFWTRRGRRFVQIALSGDVGHLSSCPLLAWSTYTLEPVGEDGLRYTQQVGAPSPADPGPVNWTGDELVAFKAHLPSRIRVQNVKLLDGTNGTTERGNILTWAQTLADRRAGKPLSMIVDMDRTSILHTTLWLFAGAFAAAVFLLVVIVWLIVRKGRRSTLH